MTRAIPIAMLLVLSACERPELASGAECTLNSDCADPLVCGLERCRRQCVDSRDCGAGLRCLNIGSMGGACQLPEESECTLTSQCGPQLECRFGTCTTACVDDRDCPPGATCQFDDATMANACVEPIAELCIYDSDCPEPLICDEDQRCRLECRNERDCPRNRTCIDNLCQLIDGG